MRFKRQRDKECKELADRYRWRRKGRDMILLRRKGQLKKKYNINVIFLNEE